MVKFDLERGQEVARRREVAYKEVLIAGTTVLSFFLDLSKW